MVDYNKPIPKVEFLSNKLPVADPSDEPMVYMDDKFICLRAIDFQSMTLTDRFLSSSHFGTITGLRRPKNFLTRHLKRSIIRLFSAFHFRRIISCFRHCIIQAEQLTLQ